MNRFNKSPAKLVLLGFAALVLCPLWIPLLIAFALLYALGDLAYDLWTTWHRAVTEHELVAVWKASKENQQCKPG